MTGSGMSFQALCLFRLAAGLAGLLRIQRDLAACGTGRPQPLCPPSTRCPDLQRPRALVRIHSHTWIWAFPWPHKTDLFSRAFAGKGSLQQI